MNLGNNWEKRDILVTEREATTELGGSIGATGIHYYGNMPHYKIQSQ
eukprot:CAMPEP_0114498220 /NCGR_PEP_ID=MMETSP0109-20121206/6761_1 /TAXON_ID=29199 /ORGANISM="Chlorarachnion reptans, Strain CCCM449" /LENGTH=46 /DNA_ID= /DNA_START= /DNA_END= /DNA_ORIENTATION=